MQFNWNVTLEGIAACVTAAALILAGAWALIQFRRDRLVTRAKWIADLYKDFYLEDPLASHRKYVEDNYDTVIAPQLQTWLRTPEDNRYPRFRRAEDAEPQFDLTLGFLEMIADLNMRKQISNKDVASLFDYWLRWIASKERPELRLYVTRFGYEGVARIAARAAKEKIRQGALEDEFLVAVYGTLRPESEYWQRFVEFAERERQLSTIHATAMGEGTAPGVLYRLDGRNYPGLRAEVPPSGVQPAKVVLLKLGGTAELAAMDAYERSSPEGAHAYQRQFLPIRLPSGDLKGAWVYVYVGGGSGEVVTNGDWMSVEAVMD